MTKVDYRYVSADTHLDLIWAPADLWSARVPARIKDIAPHLESIDGTLRWVWEGKTWGTSNLDPKYQPGSRPASAFVLSEAFSLLPEPIPAGSLPPSDPNLLLDHMDYAHIYASTIYGPTRKPTFEDPEIGRLCNMAWNDFLLDISSVAPDRIIGLCNLPTAYPDKCVAEVERVVARGAKGVEFSVFDAAEPVWSDVWDKTWSAIEEAGIPVGFHIGHSLHLAPPKNDHGRVPAHYSLSPFATQEAMAHLIFCGALDRHPHLKVVFAECRVGWLEFYVEHMDRQQRERATDVSLKLAPSEYWRRQIAATWEDDIVGAHLMCDEESLVSSVAMWGSDYPHNSVSWPNTDALMAELMKGVSEKTKHTVLAGRACDFYGISLPE